MSNHAARVHGNKSVIDVGVLDMETVLVLSTAKLES